MPFHLAPEPNRDTKHIFSDYFQQIIIIIIIIIDTDMKEFLFELRFFFIFFFHIRID